MSMNACRPFTIVLPTPFVLTPSGRIIVCAKLAMEAAAMAGTAIISTSARLTITIAIFMRSAPTTSVRTLVNATLVSLAMV